MSTDHVLIKGAGDLASGVASVLKNHGYRVIMTEVERPTCVRRMVSFAEAVFFMEDNKAIFKRLLSSIRSGNPAVLYTLVDTKGYTDIKTGSRLLICSGGRKYGTLGKESLDLEMQARGEKILSSSVPGTGLIESTVKMLEESYFPRKKLLVFGGGHVSLPLVEMAGISGY